MPTPDDVDRTGSYGPIDLHNGGGTAYIHRWDATTVDGLTIRPGRWYLLLSTDGVTTLGFIDASRDGEMYAFDRVSMRGGLGAVVRTLNEGIRYLASIDA